MRLAVPTSRPLSRLTETRLLFWVAAITVTGFFTVALALGQGLDGNAFIVPTAFLVIAFVVHAALAMRGLRGDQIMLPVSLGLTGIGLIVIYRVTAGTDAASLLTLQLAWFVVAMAAFLLPLFVPRDLSLLSRYKYTWMTFGLLLLVATVVRGEEINGARIWFRLGPLSFTPWELVKIVLVVFLAAYLDEYREVIASRRGIWRVLPPPPYLVPIVAMAFAAMFILAFEKDIGATLVFFGIFLAMLYLGTGRATYVVAGVAILIPAAYVVYRLYAHVQLRVEMWQNPWQDALGSGYQILHGLFSLGNGGLLGAGLGAGDPQSIPVVWSDFVFAAFAEETGFIGALALLAMYLVLLYRGFSIAIAAPTTFLQLLAAGLTFVIGMQTLVIVAGNAKLIPLTGITLPFVAYGGSSLVTNFLSIGLLLRISAESRT
ncbi:MAG: FtsW/RodA/SpoVE family cell cycle protein [Chloroflexi bacterium]|nr:MAG: FtsW/RodA/SpoVE family cell cycle protein [Chloroflexota bacterium]